VFTVACGFAQNFVQLVLCRIGVGIGEAGCTPPAHSLITDFLSGPMGLGSAEGVRWSLMIFILFGAVASALFWMARRSIREEMVS
jgi:MFS family permease